MGGLSNEDQFLNDIFVLNTTQDRLLAVYQLDFANESNDNILSQVEQRAPISFVSLNNASVMIKNNTIIALVSDLSGNPHLIRFKHHDEFVNYDESV